MGYIFKGQNELALRPHQSSGERKNRATCREESEGDSEELTKKTEQYWDKIWTRQRGLRRDTPPSPLFLTHPETVVVWSKPKIILGVLCFRLLLLQ